MKKYRIRSLLLALLLGCFSQAQAADQQLVHKITMCESHRHHKNVWGDGGKAYGIAQFHEETFYRFAKQAHLKHMHWKNEVDQIVLLNWALDHGHSKSWTCFKIVQGVKFAKE